MVKTVKNTVMTANIKIPPPMAFPASRVSFAPILRPTTTVIPIESPIITIVSVCISILPVATAETLNIVGTVEHVDVNYYFIQLTDSTTGQSRQVFVKKNATIIDGETQKSKTLSSIKEGSLVTAVVSSNGFTSEAISIVILPNK